MKHTMSVGGRRELVRVNYARYQLARGAQKKLILDEFVAASGYHRKYALEVLNHPPRVKKRAAKLKRRRRYGVPVRQALVGLWKTANRICSKRLVELLPDLIDALQRHGEYLPDQPVLDLLLDMSPATMDRLLTDERRSMQTRGRCTTKPGTLLRQQIPVRTFADWNEKEAGFAEVDLVAHCDDNGGGDFLYSLMVTDVHTGWCEYEGLLNKGRFCTVEAMDRVKQRLPFLLKGIDSDNGSEFINGHMLTYCTTNELTFTRGRPYRKNDQCHVEQKNWGIIRNMVGYSRFEGHQSCAVLNELYQVLRLYENFFQPCMKLVSKERRITPRGERMVKKYDAARTPYHRVIEATTVSKEVKDKLRVQYEQLNPRALLAEVSRLQEKLWALAINRGAAVTE